MRISGTACGFLAGGRCESLLQITLTEPATRVIAANYRSRNRDFVPCPERASTPTLAPHNNTGETMELLQLEPPDYGVHRTGIYIIDDDCIAVFAGPFESETAAIGWIDRRQEMLISVSRSETAIN